LELKRNCGWLSVSGSGAQGVVWIRKQVGLTTCPVSYITPESIGLLEEFHVWKLFGTTNPYELPARVVEAICILENERRSETQNGEQ
jgi:hypothetical protein